MGEFNLIKQVKCNFIIILLSLSSSFHFRWIDLWQNFFHCPNHCFLWLKRLGYDISRRTEQVTKTTNHPSDNIFSSWSRRPSIANPSRYFSGNIWNQLVIQEISLIQPAQIFWSPTWFTGSSNASQNVIRKKSFCLLLLILIVIQKQFWKSDRE